MGLTAYSDIFALHTDSPFSYSKGCEFNGTLGAVYDEDNFGIDGESNSAFRCMHLFLGFDHSVLVWKT